MYNFYTSWCVLLLVGRRLSPFHWRSFLPVSILLLPYKVLGEDGLGRRRRENSARCPCTHEWLNEKQGKNTECIKCYFYLCIFVCQNFIYRNIYSRTKEKNFSIQLNKSWVSCFTNSGSVVWDKSLSLWPMFMTFWVVRLYFR